MLSSLTFFIITIAVLHTTLGKQSMNSLKSKKNKERFSQSGSSTAMKAVVALKYAEMLSYQDVPVPKPSDL